MTLFWIIVIPIVAVVVALSIWDIFRHHLGGGPTAGWVLLVIVLPLIGSVIWWAARKPMPGDIEAAYLSKPTCAHTTRRAACRRVAVTMADTEPKAGGWRRPLAVVLIVAATLVAFLAILSIWLNRQALNTDNWTRTSSELLQQPVIRDQLAARLTEELYHERRRRGRAARRAARRARRCSRRRRPTRCATQVEKTARKALARPDVQALWVDANRSAHEQLLRGAGRRRHDRLHAERRGRAQRQRLLAQLQQEVGVGGRLRKVLPASASQITLMRSDQLRRPRPCCACSSRCRSFSSCSSLALFGPRSPSRPAGGGAPCARTASASSSPAWRVVRALARRRPVRLVAGDARRRPSRRSRRCGRSRTELLVTSRVATIAYGVVMMAGGWLAGPTRMGDRGAPRRRAVLALSR